MVSRRAKITTLQKLQDSWGWGGGILVGEHTSLFLIWLKGWMDGTLLGFPPPFFFAQTFPKICKLTDDQKVKRTETCEDFITVCDLDIRTIRKSLEWSSKNSTQSRFQKSKVKTMLIAFFDKDAIIHREFVPDCQTVCLFLFNSFSDIIDQFFLEC